MARVMHKFMFASIAMWITPILILYGFNHHIFPGSCKLSSSSLTLISGFFAVVSVNLVIVLYIVSAMKEPINTQPQPDPSFLAAAKASINKPNILLPSENNCDDVMVREKAD